MKKIVLLLLLLLVFGDFAFGQVTFLPVPIAFPQIAVGGDAGGQNYVTVLQIVNNNSYGITGHLALYSDGGTALPVLFDGQGPQSTIDIALESGKTRQIQLTLNGAITAGWMQIRYSPSDALTTVILQFRSGETLLSEVGVQPSFDTILQTNFAAETDATLNTGIAIANPSTVTENVLVGLWDPASGAVLASTALSLPANGHTAKLLTELFPTAANITQIRTAVSIVSCSSVACPGGSGFIATALRLNGDQFTTIPVTSTSSGGDLVRILPQVAFGGPKGGLNMKTVLYFTTNVATGVFGTADILDDDGNPLVASVEGGSASSSFTFTVAGNRVSRVVLSSDRADVTSAWIRLKLSSSVNLVASAVFQTFNGANLVSEASVLESPAVTRGLIYVKVQSGLTNVGVAFANSQPTPNTISLTLFNKDGFVSATRDITLPANGHLARFVTELFDRLSDFDGALSITSTTSFSALALRLSGDKIATLPVSSNGMYRPSITNLRITRTQRSPAQVSFEVDITDFDNDLATSSSTAVAADAAIDFGSAGADSGAATIDGTALIGRPLGTLSGTFQPPNVVGAVPSGFQAVFYLRVYDSAGNDSNVVSIPIRF